MLTSSHVDFAQSGRKWLALYQYIVLPWHQLEVCVFVQLPRVTTGVTLSTGHGRKEFRWATVGRPLSDRSVSHSIL